jgi:hypothetical protein
MTVIFHCIPGVIGDLAKCLIVGPGYKPLYPPNGRRGKIPVNVAPLFSSTINSFCSLYDTYFNQLR